VGLSVGAQSGMLAAEILNHRMKMATELKPHNEWWLKVVKTTRRWIIPVVAGAFALTFALAVFSAHTARELCDNFSCGMPRYSTHFTLCLGSYIQSSSPHRFNPGWIITYATKEGESSESFYVNLRCDVLGQRTPAPYPELMKAYEEMGRKSDKWFTFWHELGALSRTGSPYSNLVTLLGPPQTLSTGTVDGIVMANYRIVVPWIPGQTSTANSSTIGFSIVLSNDVVVRNVSGFRVYK
jgi:hypothetical protein